MNFIDLFSGIGGFRLGMERAGHTCLGHVEIDKFANASYEAIFGKGDLIGTDITTISNEKWREYRGKVECICGGFPCQAFSIAGQRRGFEDTRGTLFFEILRAAKEIKPAYLFLENVKGLLSHNQGETFQTMLTALDELGYDAEWCVLNSKDFGVPQNRERIFIVGHLRGRSTGKIFSIGQSSEQVNELQVQGITTNTLTARYPGSQGVGSWIVEDRKPKTIGNINPSKKGINGEVYIAEKLAPTLTTNKGEGLKILTDDIKIRKLTPRECWRLQGFPDWTFDKAREVNSDSQLYKQAGNSVTVNVIEWIAKKLKLGDDKNVEG